MNWDIGSMVYLELDLEKVKVLKKEINDIIGKINNIIREYNIYNNNYGLENVVDLNDGMLVDDIINFTIEILVDNPDILEYYSDKFRHVLVDEYQDTNKAQFTLVTLFASKFGNITVVGDNDQGIYSFRGADITNILNFEKDLLR